jgi:aspartate aminotransferase
MADSSHSPFSRRVTGIQESLTVACFARIGEMKRRHDDVISLVAGEPDFPTPEHVRAAAVRAINEGRTRYTSPATGILELKQAVCRKLETDNGLSYEPTQVNVACGAKQIIFDAAAVLVDDGDEVVIPAPYWVSYADQVRLMGGRPRIVETSSDAGFRMTAEQLSRAITPRTKLLMLNSPCNPTGEVYTPQELKALADVAADAGIYVIADEIYEKLVYDGAQHVSIAALDPRLQKRTLVVNGVSKAYAMTGWRVGYGAGPQDLIDLMAKVQSQETTNTCTISQYAALEALTGPQDAVSEMRQAFRERREVICRRLNEIPGIACRKPLGAFYVFPDVTGLCEGSHGRVADDVALCDYLIDRCHVGAVPGAGFGAPGHIRFSYAASLPDIEAAMDRLARAAADLC